MIKKAVNYFSFSIASSLVGLISLPYLTRVLNPDEFAYIGLAGAIQFLVVPIYSFMSVGLIGVYKVNSNFEEYILFRNTYINFFIFLVLLIFIIFIPITYLFLEQYFTLVLLVLFIGINRFFIRFHDSEIVQDGKSILYGSLNFWNSLFLLLVTVILLSYFTMSWEGRLLAIFIVDLVFTLIRIKKYSNIFDTYSFEIDKKILKDIIKFGAPLFIALGASWITFQSDKVIITNFFSMEIVGLYTVAYSVGSLLDRINQAVRNTYVPIIRNDLKNNFGKIKIKKIQLYYSAVILSVATVVSLVFYYYADIILGEEYASIGSIVIFVSFGYAFFGIYSAYGSVLEYYKLTKVKTKFVIYGAILNLIFSLGLLPVFGFLAPAIGTFVSFVSIMFISMSFAKQELEKRGVKD